MGFKLYVLTLGFVMMAALMQETIAEPITVTISYKEGRQEKKRFDVGTDTEETVKNLRAKVANIIDEPESFTGLIYNRELLLDSYTLDRYGINDGAVITARIIN